MKTTIDAAGRILIPKTLRIRLGFVAGNRSTYANGMGVLKIEPERTARTLVEKKGGAVAAPHRRLPTLSDEAVRETLERSRR